MRIAHSSGFPPRRLAATLSLLLLALAILPTSPAAGAPWPFGGRPKREGDVLRVFDNAIVYVVTNDDAGMADLLLEGCKPRERRVLSLDEWGRLPEAARWYVSPVFLVNRERLPAEAHFPESCLAENDELWAQGTRRGRNWGIAHEIVVSAPDAAWLRRAVEEFRQLKELPRGPLRRNVRALAVIPVGASAGEAAASYLKKDGPVLAHALAPDAYEAAGPRLAHADEVLLVDRSARESLPPAIKAVLAARPAGAGQTLSWRERKAGGRSRVVFSAPNADLLLAAVRRCPDPLSVAEIPTVLAAARDLRQVRRIAVAGLRNGAGGPELARRLASQTATAVRALDAFEVLERAGLAEILGEIALDQAGITRAGDRARVRQLAAADALLIVEVTDITGNTEYEASQERLTPRMERPPARPLEPSRLRWTPALPGKENDPLTRAASEVLLKRMIGMKSEREYKEALDYYNTVTLPRWQQRRDDWERRYRTRPVSWRQTVVASGTATIKGSLRLVDLADGLVLWEAPFEGTEQDSQPQAARTVTEYGEDSAPATPASPADSAAPPDALIDRAADAALARGILALRGTALLPAPAIVAETPDEAPVSSSPSGRLLDVDGDTLLIGLGTGEGVKIGDALLVRLPDGRTVRALVTRVRPRTCDATFDKNAPGDLRLLVAIGQTAVREQ